MPETQRPGHGKMGEQLRVEAFIDHASPYAYLQFEVLRRMVAEQEADVRWHLLPPADSADGELMFEALFAASWPDVEDLARSAFGIELRRPPTNLDWRPAAAAVMRVRETAPEREADLHAALFGARFGRADDIGTAEVVDAALAELGLAPTGQGSLGNGEDLGDQLHTALAGDQRRAVEVGVSSTPSLVLGGRLIMGAIEREALVSLAEGSSSDRHGPGTA